MYIGKKIFMAASRKQVKGKIKKTKKVSNWQKYYGSNADLQNEVLTLGEEQFIRQILRLCKSKSTLSYYEMKEIFERDALLSDMYYNRWVSCRINKGNLKEIYNANSTTADKPQ